MLQPLLLGVEIGGTKLQLGLGRGDGSLIALSRLKIVPRNGARGILDQIAKELPTLLQRTDVCDQFPNAVGIGFGGPVDSTRGTILRSHQVRGWDDFDLGGWARSELGIPLVAVENDADTAGLGESCFGAGVGLSPIFYITIGSGIGGGLILDGGIYRGSGMGAAEIGHLWIESGEEEPRQLEDLASGWAIGSIARKLPAFRDRDPAEVDAEFIAAQARQGDPSARTILEQATRGLGTAIGHVVTLLAPRRIILGGGVSLIEDRLWLDPIRNWARRRVFPPFLDSFDIRTAKLGEDVVVHGALALARDLICSETDGNSNPETRIVKPKGVAQ
ncbi:ROK family protein [Tundrisphaera lichenicola]|uniref:ROK family protein n=1 Tax=Tundrisphaera lichenicola TaxID=2029860 RepID=UPI003EBE11C0